jgi:hypothetical protein
MIFLYWSDQTLVFGHHTPAVDSFIRAVSVLST